LSEWPCRSFASGQRSGYQSVEGVFKTTFSKSERGKNDLADTGGWLGPGIVGLVIVFRPQRKG
jgi:hypothetical protein